MKNIIDKKPEVGDSVVVKEPERGNEDIDCEPWSHSFIGHITDILTHDGEPDLYIIEDQDSDFFEMERDRFTLDGEEEE